MDDLAPLLDDRAERDRRGSVRLRGGRRMADLLRELTPSDRQQILFGAIRLALRDRPVALVPARKERAARMAEQDLRLAGRRRPAEEEDSGALPHRHPRIVEPVRRPFGIHPHAMCALPREGSDQLPSHVADARVPAGTG